MHLSKILKIVLLLPRRKRLKGQRLTVKTRMQSLKPSPLLRRRLMKRLSMPAGIFLKIVKTMVLSFPVLTLGLAMEREY